MINYELILILSAFGYVWSEILTREGMIFGWVPGIFKRAGFSEFSMKPLYACAVCVTGFWSLLLLLYLVYIADMQVPVVSTTVLAMLLTKILTRYA